MMKYIEQPDYPDLRSGIYREINNWESYELRNNIAYEMAIRNKKNLYQLKKYIKLIKCISFDKGQYSSIKIDKKNIDFLEVILQKNQEILLNFKEFGDDIRFTLFKSKNYSERISSKIISILNDLEQRGFTMEAVDFYITISLFSEIYKFKTLTQWQIHQEIMDKSHKYHYLSKYFTCLLSSDKLQRKIECPFIEDRKNNLYSVVLEENGLWAYRKNKYDVLDKYSQINPMMGFKNEVAQSYQLQKSRPLMVRPYRHKNILLNINMNQSSEALKDEIVAIQSLLLQEKKDKNKDTKKYTKKRIEETNRYKRITKKGLATLKLAFYFFHRRNSSTTTEDLHHVVEHNVDRPKDSRTSDDPTYFSDGLYLFDCTMEWYKHRQKIKRNHTDQVFKDEETPFKNFIFDRYNQLGHEHTKIDSDHLAKRLLRDFQRYIDGASYNENKKYQKERLEYHQKRQEIYKLDIDDDEKRIKLLHLKRTDSKDPNYFSLI